MSFVDLNRSGVALMEIVSQPDMRSSEEARGLCDEAAHDPALSRHLRRRHGEGQPARRRQRLGAPARRAARHALRDQERQLDPLHRPGDRVSRRAARSRSSRTAARSTRRRACSIPARARRARCAPRKRRTTTATSPIRTCCRWSSTRPRSTRWPSDLPELPDAKKARFIAEYGLSPYDAGVLVAERASADFFEAVAQGPRRQGGGELGDQRAVRPPQQGRARTIDDVARLGRRSSARIVDLIGEGTISGKIAKDLFEIVWTEGGDPRAHRRERAA